MTTKRQTGIIAAAMIFAMGALAYAQGFNLNNLLPGTAPQPTIASNIDPTTGIYFPAPGQVGFTGGGVQVAGTSAAGFNFGRNGNPVVIETVPIGSVAYGSFGNNTTLVAGTTYFVQVQVGANTTLTGFAPLTGTTNGGTDKWIVALYNSAGTLVANSALAGTTTSASANTFQKIPFTATYAALGPGRYWAMVQSNGTTDTLRTIATLTFVSANASSATGAFGTVPASFTPPATVTANVGPIGYLY